VAAVASADKYRFQVAAAVALAVVFAVAVGQQYSVGPQYTVNTKLLPVQHMAAAFAVVALEAVAVAFAA